MLNAVLTGLEQSASDMLQMFQQHILLVTALACGTSSAAAVFIVSVVSYKLHRERNAERDVQPAFARDTTQ
jgi:hypothetical protein